MGDPGTPAYPSSKRAPARCPSTSRQGLRSATSAFRAILYPCTVSTMHLQSPPCQAPSALRRPAAQSPMPFRRPTAAFDGRTAGWLSRLTRRGGGTAVSGLVTSALDPDFVPASLAAGSTPPSPSPAPTAKPPPPPPSAALARAAGQPVLTNPTGSNLERGLAAALLPHVNLDRPNSRRPQPPRHPRTRRMGLRRPRPNHPPPRRPLPQPLPRPTRPLRRSRPHRRRLARRHRPSRPRRNRRRQRRRPRRRRRHPPPPRPPPLLRRRR